MNTVQPFEGTLTSATPDAVKATTPPPPTKVVRIPLEQMKRLYMAGAFATTRPVKCPVQGGQPEDGFATSSL